LHRTQGLNLDGGCAGGQDRRRNKKARPSAPVFREIKFSDHGTDWSNSPAAVQPGFLHPQGWIGGAPAASYHGGGEMPQRRTEIETMPVTVTPLTPAVGAQVADVDLRALGDADFSAIERAWHRYSVLLFRDQALSDDDLLAFSRRLGELDPPPNQE